MNHSYPISRQTRNQSRLNHLCVLTGFVILVLLALTTVVRVEENKMTLAVESLGFKEVQLTAPAWSPGDTVARVFTAVDKHGHARQGVVLGGPLKGYSLRLYPE